MKTSRKTRWLRQAGWLLANAAAVAVLCTAVNTTACDACNLVMINKLVNRERPSLHAAEMSALINKAEGPSAAKLRASLAAMAGPASSYPGINLDRPAPIFAAPPVAQPPPSPVQLVQAAPAGRPSAPPAQTVATLVKNEFPDIVERDRKLSIPETSYVKPGTKPDKKFTLVMAEGEVALGNGVIYHGFTVNGTIPGPTLIMDEGDVVELTVVNNGEVPHGVSLHAVYTQTSKYYGKINPGESKTHTFRVNYPGVYMYHCAPGGHAIPMHTLLGQYGMMVVKPKKVKFKMDEVMGRGPDVELYMVQHELYSSGKEAVEGKPAYVMFNGSLFRYVANPIKVRPGDFVRINFLNAGPNILSTFHLVGIIWDFAYWQGLPTPENTLVGGQSVLAGPTDSWVVDFRVPPDEGNYLIVNHAFGSTTRGTIGILAAAKDAPRSPTVLADGPAHSPEEFAKLKAKAVRTISPFEPGSDELASPARLAYGEKKMRISIVGNSFYPKVAAVPAGTVIEWTNEDVFAFFEGEFSGIHDVKGIEGPTDFWSPMLGHGEKYTVTLSQKGEYKYMCTPHPYMIGMIRVE
jgi:nitrite reductase (NO-forming)